MTQQERRASRRQSTGGGEPPADQGSSLEETRERLQGTLDTARAIQAIDRNVVQARRKDQVPPGTFHRVICFTC